MMIRLDANFVVKYEHICAILEREKTVWSDELRRYESTGEVYCEIKTTDGSEWTIYRTLDELMAVIDEYLGKEAR